MIITSQVTHVVLTGGIGTTITFYLERGGFIDNYVLIKVEFLK